MPDVRDPGANPNARFLAGDVPHGAEGARFGSGLALSALTHVVGFFIVLAIIAAMPERPAGEIPPDRQPDGIVWVQSPGPGGGGGGGGNRMPDPPRKAELPGRDKVTVPVTKAPKAAPEPPKEIPEPPPAQLNIPAVTTSAGVQEMPGALTGLPSVPSQGAGTGGGAGTGTGRGMGPGRGSGLGDGVGGGTGGGVYRPGNGVTMPTLISDPKPSYTAEAMRAKIQGVVMVEAIVLADGSVGDVRVVRSLDRTFGLDQEAVRTVKRWRFSPGTRLGKPVPVQVEIELSFTLR